MTDPRRRIPAVDTLLESEPFRRVLEEAAGRDEVVASVRAVQREVRESLRSGEDTATQKVMDPEWYAARVRERIRRRDQRTLRTAINATGVVLHTNLGRAPLADAARAAVIEAAGYATLEYDVESGDRGSRYDHCVDRLRELTGAEDALVVNNNAAAVVLALNTLAEGRPAVISRGELVEIGGSFRIPEIMAKSGARMREVGATNRSHLADYADAVVDAAVILKVHRSNFRVEGFTADVGTRALAGLAADAGVPLVHDLGSGALVDLTELGLPYEPTAHRAVADGAAVVTMSGDKLLGGPQAGILVGRAELIGRMRQNPLCRAVRPDKLTLAGLEATLALYRVPGQALQEIPTLRMLGASEEALHDRAERLAAALRDAGVGAGISPVKDAVGGGACPGVALAGYAVTLEQGRADPVARSLRTGTPAVVGRVQDDRVLLHVRTVPSDRETDLVAAVVAALEPSDGR